MKKLVSLTVCAWSALLFAPTVAYAFDTIGVEAGAKVGAGIPLDTEPNTILGLGFGLGARAGITFFNVYAGVAGVYYFGQSKVLAGGTDTLHTLMLGVEGGYDFKLLPHFTLRPQLGLGDHEYYQSNSASLASKSSSYFYIEPAIVALVPMGNFYLGADAGTRILPAGPATTACEEGADACHTFHIGLTLHVQAGVRF